MIIFNNIKYAGEEQAKAKIHSCRLLTLASFFKRTPTGYDTSRMDKDTVINTIKSIGKDNSMVVLDLESWPLQGSMETIQETMNKMLEIVDLFRIHSPGLRLGIYPVPPRTGWHGVLNYYRFKNDKTSKWWPQAQTDYNWWKSQSKQYTKGTKSNYKVKSILDNVDFTCPDIYIPYSDDASLAFWPTYAKEHIKVARTYRKQIYCYISPYVGGKDQVLIPTKNWLTMLDTCNKYADGAIIYTCVTLDPNIEWWTATKEWIAKNADDYQRLG